MPDSKKYVLFAGVNGVGKSTLYYLHPEMQNIARINIDEIAKELGRWDDMNVVFEAGKRAVRLKKHYFAEGITFNQETTLCGHDPINSIKKARESGYIIEMHYVGVDSVEICKARIRERVQKGGHGIPDELVDRRYKTSFDNLNLAIPLCNKVLFYDNTEDMKLFCIYDSGAFQYLGEIPKWFADHVHTGK